MFDSNYIKEYTTIPKQGIECIGLSREYLVYATILGVADEAVKQFYMGNTVL